MFKNQREDNSEITIKGTFFFSEARILYLIQCFPLVYLFLTAFVPDVKFIPDAKITNEFMSFC